MKEEPLLPPLHQSLDPAWRIELEPGKEYEWTVLYPDGHIETGKLIYSGESTWIPTHTNSGEFCRIPTMIPITRFTEGKVQILKWGK